MNEPRKNPSVVIIGAGMTGMLMMIKLREAGITDITILEKKDSVGGTWRENTYPGVACDIPSHMYTYSFEPNPEWSQLFAPGEEIRDYFERVSRKYGIQDCVRFNEAVISSIYENGKWHIETSKGQQISADFLISATGILHQPVKPALPGLDSFAGRQFHTAEWDHEVELRGKRVGVVGTGSTAVQVISELVDYPGTQVNVFQRTPQWIFNAPNSRFSEKQKQRFRDNPGRMHQLRARMSRVLEQIFIKAVTGTGPLDRLKHAFLSWNCKRYLGRVKNPELRRKLTPDYKVGCKRLIVSSTFYDAIQKDNAVLTTEGIERVVPEGIITADGQLHELDVLVLATGFDPFSFMRPMQFVGRDGVSIEQAWSRKVSAYRSVLLPQFPNFFLMLGPNTPIGNFSVIAMSEVQAAYVIKLIDQWRRGELATVEASVEATRRFNRYLKAGFGSTVWTGGCQSWYLDADGDPATWPYSWGQWVAEMAEPDLRDFVTVAEQATQLEMAA